MLFRNKKERTIGTQKDIDAFQNNYVVWTKSDTKSAYFIIPFEWNCRHYKLTWIVGLGTRLGQRKTKYWRRSKSSRKSFAWWVCLLFYSQCFFNGAHMYQNLL
jgi:hypothetical protein